MRKIFKCTFLMNGVVRASNVKQRDVISNAVVLFRLLSTNVYVKCHIVASAISIVILATVKSPHKGDAECQQHRKIFETKKREKE